MSLNKVLFITATFIVTSICSYGQTAEEAHKYLSELTSSLDDFRQETWYIVKSTVGSRSVSDLDYKIHELTTKIRSTREELTSDEGFYGDLSVKVAMRIYLRTAANILTEDYQDIKALEVHSHHSFKNMERYLQAQNKANDRLSEGGERLDVELKRFADRYGVVVTEEKYLLAEKIEKSSAAMAYYNQTYLSFFKAHEQKLRVYEALRTGDFDRIREENSLLLLYCNESLDRLDIQDAFYGDEALWNAANNILNHFKYEATEVYPSSIRAIEKQQIFNLAQKVFDEKPEEERSQGDVNHINALIDPLNAAIDIQNSLFTKADSERTKLFNEWNSQINAFFAAYIS